MQDKLKIDVIIPAYNEEESIGLVIKDLPLEIIREVVVANNGSTDSTEMRAKDAGASVVYAGQPGYGSACLEGIAYLKEKEEHPDVVVFIDGDYSDHGSELASLLHPIEQGDKDLIIGSRALGNAEKGSMTVPQVFGNWLATNLIRMIYNYRFTDLGPFRAIRWESLMLLDMKDKDFGWTVEMQVKAAKYKLRTAEVPVSYRKRIGVSKISGTIKGTLLAGHKILWTIFKLI